MQLDLDQKQVEVLQSAVKGRIDALLMGIANTDARDYREDLMSEEMILQDIYAKLGCVYPERSSETTCSVDG